jgi:CheY-like chemotaxis protein
LESAPVLKPKERASLPRGRERILFVDDEPALAIALKQILEHLGYEVEYSTNGIEALEIFRLHLSDKPFDLVISDMTMPHITGVDLAMELLRLKPNIPIVLCTGFSEKMNAKKAKSIGVRGFLMKPVVARELAEMVREVLNKQMK